MAGLFDYYSPFMSARLVVGSNNYPLWMGTEFPANSGFTGIPLKALCFVTDIVLTLKMGYLCTIQVTLEPPFNEGMEFINSELIEFGLSTIEVQFGYTAGLATGNDSVLSPIFTGILLAPEVSVGETITITLNAQSGHDLLREQAPQEPFGKTTRLKAIEATLEAIPKFLGGADIQVDTTLVGKYDEKAKAVLETEEIDITCKGEAAWSFIYRLIKEADCSATMVGNKTLRIFPMEMSRAKKSMRTYRFFSLSGGIIDTSDVEGSFPLLSFDSQTTAVFLPTSQMAVKGYDPSTKEHVEESITDEETQVSRTNPGGTAGAPVRSREDILALTKVELAGPEEQFVKDALSAEQKRFSQEMGIVADITTLADPLVFPGEICTIAGLGFRYDGNYGIFEIEHSLGGGGYSSKMHIISNTETFLSNTSLEVLQPKGKDGGPEGSDASERDDPGED